MLIYISSASGIGFNIPASPVLKVHSNYPATYELKVAQTITTKSNKIISKGKAYSTKKLSFKVISEGFIVYEKLYV